MKFFNSKTKYDLGPQDQIIDRLIDESSKSILAIGKRIEYLRLLKENIDSVAKAQEQHKRILEFLIKKTNSENKEAEELNDIMQLK